MDRAKPVEGPGLWNFFLCQLCPSWDWFAAGSTFLWGEAGGRKGRQLTLSLWLLLHPDVRGRSIFWGTAHQLLPSCTRNTGLQIQTWKPTKIPNDRRASHVHNLTPNLHCLCILIPAFQSCPIPDPTSRRITSARMKATVSPYSDVSHQTVGLQLLGTVGCRPLPRTIFGLKAQISFHKLVTISVTLQAACTWASSDLESLCSGEHNQQLWVHRIANVCLSWSTNTVQNLTD